MATRPRKQPAPDSTRSAAQEMAGRADTAADLLKALANPQRLRILCLLHDSEMSVGQLNQHVELSQSALSQHLAVLREKALVQTRRDAQTVYYTLAPGPVSAIIHTLHGIYCAGC